MIASERFKAEIAKFPPSPGSVASPKLVPKGGAGSSLLFETIAELILRVEMLEAQARGET